MAILYSAIGNDLDYNHLTVNHTYNFVDTITGVLKAHGTEQNQGIESTMADSHMCEFMRREKLNGRNAFELILEHIAKFWQV